MGVVYLAEDTRLHRKVALKFLPPAVAQEHRTKARFEREAQAASALDHPHVATVYEIGEWQGQPFIAMAYYDGETLKQRLEHGPLPIADVVAIAAQIAAGLAAAHGAGVVHRDLKPANIILTRDGQAKILDFGLAKVLRDDEETSTRITRAGATLGTVAYMAPEQARGEEVDARADIWAFGVLLYEMLTGALPFSGDHATAMLSSLLSDAPAPLRQRRPEVPTELDRIVLRALEKNPAARTMRAADIAAELNGYRLKIASGELAASRAAPPGLRRFVPVVIPALLVLLLAGGWLGWSAYRTSRERAARRGLVDIERLVEQEQLVEAFLRAREIQPFMAGDPAFTRLWSVVARSTTVVTEPAGADVYVQAYNGPPDAWIHLGRSPLKNVPAPRGWLRWKVERPGFVTAMGAPPIFVWAPAASVSFRLFTPADVPENMVYVEPQTDEYSLFIPGLDHLPPVRLDGFWIDRHEVTNREFKRFVDAGGYRNRDYWTHPFLLHGTTLSWDDAIVRFRDATGQPGPASWEVGRYPEGEAEHPVSGVSWYEAAAYAAFAGKALPTIYHWSMAAEQRNGALVVPLSNFSGRGVAPVGQYRGMNAHGTFDMAGNVKEWCANPVDGDKRYILGGAWDEPVYMFTDVDARDPMDRAATFGFRLIKHTTDRPLPPAVAGEITVETRDYTAEKPVSDELFRAYRSLYAYDRTDLAPSVEWRDDSHDDWVREKVSFAAAYGGERVTAYLYLPKRRAVPYQTIVLFPGSGALHMRSSERDIQHARFEFLMKSGRAVVHPVFKSTFERGDELKSDYPNLTTAWRDHVVMWFKDMARTIDYLETRPDIDRERLGYYGISWGGQMGSQLPALEPRLKAIVLDVGGFPLQKALPEADPINFAPRITAPVLMLNGRYDFFFPTRKSQEPMVRFLGTAPEHKRYVVYESGHNIPRYELIKETISWFDRYLGPVK
jgi:formylglycine-generating enzyme required for sulfatase activity/dienelactone hydrolase/tRNA A-37 threonylcarbamoyl transferase component Bud32